MNYFAATGNKVAAIWKKYKAAMEAKEGKPFVTFLSGVVMCQTKEMKSRRGGRLPKTR